MTEYLEEKTPRYMFSGKKSDYPVWEVKYKARASVKGFGPILTGAKVLRKQSEIDNETDADKRKEDEAIQVMNNKAISDMILSISTDTTEGRDAFNIVSEKMNEEDYPNGNAKDAWDQLKLEFEPKSITSYVKLKNQFNSRKLKRNEKPKVWINELCKMRERMKEMKHPMSDEDFYIQIIGNIPMKMYRSEIKEFRKELEAGTLTLDKIKTELNDAFDDFDEGSDGSEESKEDEDIALIGGGFKGYCNNCGKYGHKKHDCPKLTTEERERMTSNRQRNPGQGRSRYINGKCHYCGKWGHRKADCRNNPENWNYNGDRNNADDRSNGGNGTHRGEQSESEDDVADIILMATEPERKKKYQWYDWCLECESDEDASGENVTVHTIALGPNEVQTCDIFGRLNDDFFDDFSFANDRNDDDLNEETFAMTENYDQKVLTFFDAEQEKQQEMGEDEEKSDNDPEMPDLANMQYEGQDKDSEGSEEDANSMPDLIKREDMSNSDDSSLDDEAEDTDLEPNELPFEDDDVPGENKVEIIWALPHEIVESDLVPIDIVGDEEGILEYNNSGGTQGGSNETVATDNEDKSEGSVESEILVEDEYKDVEDKDDGDEGSKSKFINARLNEIALTNMDKWEIVEMKLRATTWFGDSAASTHMCNDDTNMYDCQTINEEIRVGSGKTIRATKIGKLKVKIRQTTGKVTVVALTNVKFVPELWCNLFSLTAVLDKGFNLGNQGKVITVSKGDVTIGFDRIFPTTSGFIMAADMEQIGADTAAPVLEAGREIDIRHLHGMYAHPGETVLRNTAAAYNLKVKAKMEKCEDCALSKARQANLNKQQVPRETIVGQKLMMDIASVKAKSSGGNKFWLQVTDDASDYVWSMFLKKKSELSKRMVAMIKDLRARGYPAKIIRCDRAGENIKFRDDAVTEGLGLTFEFTPPNTPQRNGRVERKFATLFGRERAMMNGARITKTMRQNLWAECAATATKVENMLVYKRNGTSSYQKFWKKEAPYARHLRTFGEMAVIKVATKIKGKLENRGRTVMFVGYADESAPDTYKFFDPKTQKISRSRDVQWLNKTYGEWRGIQRSTTRRVTQTVILEDEVDDEAPSASASMGETEPTPQILRTVKRQLESWQSPDLTLRRTRGQTRLANANPESGREEATSRRVQFDDEATIVNEEPTREESTVESNEENSSTETEVIDFETENDGSPLFDMHDATDDEKEDVANVMMRNLQWPDLAMHAAEAMMEMVEEDENDGKDETKYAEPKSFQEAWNHTDPVQREKWREAIRKEFTDMIRRGVWRVMKRRDLPGGRRCVKCKWVWKIKRNGVFRARLVVCGYSQIPGVDYTEHFAPVINDVTWRILLIAMMVWKLDAWLIDIETAFLHGEFEEGETMFMNLPEGYEMIDENVEVNKDCVQLLRTAYGTVQGARRWWKKLVSILRDIGFKGGEADPCLLQWESKFGIVFMGLYVDDCLSIGKPEALQLLSEEMQKRGLTLKTDKILKDYLSCDVTFNEDKTKAILRQPHLLKTIEDDFGEIVRKLPKYKTPGTPGEGLIRNADGKATVSKEEHKMYRSGTGKLLFLVKHTRPDIANAVRELSKVLDGTTPRAMKEMKRIMKYVLDTKNMGLKIEPVIEKALMWKIVAFSDSDFAGDKDTRRSVSGFVIYLCGAPICWRSKAQRSVTLSSAEAEWIALSEVAKEVLFIAQILESMGINVDYPIVIRVDNTAAIFMANNVTTNQRTRHIDIRTKFVNQYTGPDGKLKVVFVKGMDNDSDIMTKNVTGELHVKHVPKMMTAELDNHESTK